MREEASEDSKAFLRRSRKTEILTHCRERTYPQLTMFLTFTAPRLRKQPQTARPKQLPRNEDFVFAANVRDAVRSARARGAAKAESAVC